MFTLPRAQRLCLRLAAGLAIGLMASPSVYADEAALAVLPAPGPSWDVTSGYGAVEANRATNPLAPALPVITSMVSNDVRWAPASEPSLAAVMAAAKAWDTTSGYGAVEANRAAASAVLAPDASWDETSGYGAVEANRAESSVALAPSWDVTSGYGAVEASRAAASTRIGSPDATDQAASPCLPGAVIQTLTVPTDGTLAHAAILEPGQSYQLRASGFLTTNRGTKLGVLAVDAGYRYFTRDGASTPGADRLDGIDIGLALVGADGEPDPSATWGAFTATHVYEQTRTGTGQALAFRLQHPGAWTTIAGALTVQIACA